MMRPLGNHIHAAVLRAVSGQADVAQVGVGQDGHSIKNREKPIMIVEDIRSTDWASVTFLGATHEFDLRFEGERAAVDIALQKLTARLPECDIPIAGHIVAEIAVTFGTERASSTNMIAKALTVNVLTIID